VCRHYIEVDVIPYQNATPIMQHGNWEDRNNQCKRNLDSHPGDDRISHAVTRAVPWAHGGITCHAGKMVSVNKGKWDKSRGIEENHKFTLKWLKACQRVLKPNGTIWVSGTTHIIYSVGFAMQELGYKVLNDIIWYKRNAPPNLSCRYFTHSTEIVLWAAKNEKSKHYFDYKLMKKMNQDKQMRNVWEISAPQAEEKKFGKHPTQKPVELLKRIILASTKEGDLVLDPFCGSSTTGVAAVSLNRKYVGMDLE